MAHLADTYVCAATMEVDNNGMPINGPKNSSNEPLNCQHTGSSTIDGVKSREECSPTVFRAERDMHRSIGQAERILERLIKTGVCFA